MKREEFEAIKRRCEKATPGPWQIRESIYERCCIVEPEDSNDPQAACHRPQDAEFIANARTDVPALVAEVKKLQAYLRHGYVGNIFSDKHVEAGDSCNICAEIRKALGEE